MRIDYTAEDYVDDVVEGRQVACKWIVLACKRHRLDLETGAGRGLYFDKRAAKRAIAFFPLVLRHSKGRWARQAFFLEPWQQFILWNLFGWKRADGRRRFRTAYIEVARKNGKSSLVAGIGLILLHADGEPGAEVYTAATKIEQARIIHQESIRMVKQSPMLSKELRIQKNNIHNPLTFSKFEPLGSNSDTLDGLHVHGGLIDELHAHPNGTLWDVLETGTGARDQPIMLAITTAGFNQHSFCYRQHDYSEKILEGVLTDDSWFSVIYTMDRFGEDNRLEDWENEGNWEKANPNLNVSKYIDVMRDKARKAKAQPAALNNFLTKELCVWTTASSREIDPERWALCDWGPVDLADLKGRRCWVGVDLSSTLDITAEILVFEAAGPDEVQPVLCRFWIPEDNIWDRVKNDRVPYDVWARQGFIELTPGNVIDDQYIVTQIQRDLVDFEVVEIAFDPWNAQWMANQLQAGGLEESKLVSFRQGPRSFSPAIAQLHKAIAKRTINHQGNPVLIWMASNLTTKQDSNANKAPDKEKSKERIDGIVALLMAHYRSSITMDVGSVYEDRGILEV